MIGLLVLVACSGRGLDAGSPSPVTLNDGWEYRWGDSRDDEPAAAWRPATLPGTPAGRNGQSHLWMRRTLPPNVWRDPALMAPGIDRVFEVWLEDRLVYRFGDPGRDDGLDYPGRRLHLVPLPHDFAGKRLYLRMASADFRIGVAEDLTLGARADHVLRIVQRDGDKFILSCLFVLVGLLQVGLFVRNHQRASLCLGFFAAAIGLYMITRTAMKQIFFDVPSLWLHVELDSLYLAPVGIFAFVEQLYGRGRFDVLRRVWQGHLLFALLAGGLSAAGLFSPLAPLPAFQRLFLATIVFELVYVAVKAVKGDGEARIFTAGFLIGGAFAVHDILRAMTVLPWRPLLSHWGVFFFLLTLVLILRRRLKKERARKAHLERELETAAILQARFLPAETMENDRVELCVYSRPASAVGGDWFSYHLYGKDWLHVHVGDVTGHGTGSALLATFARGATEAFYDEQMRQGRGSVALHDLHDAINRVLAVRSNDQAFLSLFSVAINLATGEMSYLNSGHMPQLLAAEGGKKLVPLLGAGNSLLGFERGRRATRPAKLQLAGDELLVLYSDGLLEAARLDGRKVNMRRLARFVGEQGAADAQTVRDRLATLLLPQVPDDPRDDDVTIVVVRLKGQRRALTKAAVNG